MALAAQARPDAIQQAEWAPQEASRHGGVGWQNIRPLRKRGLAIARVVRHPRVAQPGGRYQAHSGQRWRQLAACYSKPHRCFSLSSPVATPQQTRPSVRPHG